MFKFIKSLFACKHKHVNRGYKMDVRYDKPIVVDYSECQDCGRILHCKVTFQDDPGFKTIFVLPEKQFNEFVKKLEEPAQEIPQLKKAIEPVSVPVTAVKEEPKVEPKPEPPKVVKEEPKPAVTSDSLREEAVVEKELEKDPDEGPFSSHPDVPIKDPGVGPVEEEELEETPQPGNDSMREGGSFVKESRASINQRRNALARRRERAIAQAKKNGQIPADGKIKIKVQKKSSIPFLDAPDAPGREEEYN